MHINVNLDEVNDNNLVEEGWHIVRVIGCEQKTSQGSGNPYLNWELEVNDPDDENNGQKLWLITSLTDKALPMLKRFIRACDVEWGPEGFTTEDVLGCELEINVKHREYDGEKQNNISNYRLLS